MLPNERTTRSDVVTLPGDIEGLVAAPGRDVARPIVDFLKGQGLNIQLAVDADSAFEEALLHRPNIILIHEALPPGGGIELCQRLKGNTRTHFVPAILYAPEDKLAVRVRASAAGADDVFFANTDPAFKHARLWALLRTQALQRRQERKRLNQGSNIQGRRRWVANFVHDLQSSLGALQANFDYVTRVLNARGDANSDPELSECLSDTRTLFSQLSRGLRTVLDFERFEAGRVVLKDGRAYIGALVSEGQRELAWEAGMLGKRVDIRVPAPDAVVKGDSGLLKDAIQNLMGHVLRQPANRLVTAHLIVEDRHAVLTFGGDADRLTQGDPETLFEPYAAESSHAAVVAHGLGLALAKVVVEVHGGSLKVDVKPDGRYSFVVKLNLDSGPAEQPT